MARKHDLGWVTNRKEVAVRVAAVVCVIMAMALDGSPAALFRKQYPEYAKQVKEDHSAFCQRHYNNFIAKGTVADKKRSGRPPKVPPFVAKQASAILKAGRIVERYTSANATEPVEYHVWYSSIASACKHNQTLDYLCKLYDVAPKKLLKAMQKADPNLVRRTLDVKMWLSESKKKARKAAAERLAERYRQDPGMLDRVYFIDECKIWLSNVAKGKVKVYCDAHDDKVHAVLPCKWMAKDKDVKLHFLCAVNPVHGPVFIKMTSGTTDNIDMAGNLNAPYHVSTAARV